MEKISSRVAILGIISWMLLPGLAFAACPVNITGSAYENPIAGALNVCSIPDLLLALVDLVFLIGVPIIVIFIIYSGFLFVSARDNESQLEKARTVFFWTVVGALVLLGAKGIALAIQNTILSLGPSTAATTPPI